MKKDKIYSCIQELYGFEPYQDELNELIKKLIEKGGIELNSNNEYSLPDAEKVKFQESDLRLKDKEKARFQNFKNFITDNLCSKIENAQIILIWATFFEYLYNNFYEFGEEAFKRFHPYIEYSGTNHNDEDFFQMAYAKLKNKELSSLFRQTVEKFPDYATTDDIDFLNDIAQKTLCFASLGIDPKIAESTLDKSLVDWILYLDTNVLYSLLNLHSHPENEACKALIALIRHNKEHLKISFRYSELTKKELNAKREDFQLLDDKLTDSSIKALLRSNDLDDFSMQFYTNLLKNRDSTLHPSKVIDLAPNTLLKYEVDISRNQKRVEKIGKKYLDIRIQEYRRYIDERNAIRQQFNEDKNTNFRNFYRSDKQITHDITLREIILDQRSSVLKGGTVASLNSVKYFCVTLDSLLLDYDEKQIKDYNDANSFPVFFRPSFLLNRLVKLLPIKTTDYKKAFIKAVTSKGFNKDVQKSHDILKIVNYLKTHGIDDEQVVYNLISKDLFLEKYRKNKTNSDFDQGEFIESELNREFKEREQELIKTKKTLHEKEKEAQSKTEQTKTLVIKKETLETDLDIYKKSIKRLQSDVKRLEKRDQQSSNQSQINFEAEEKKAEADNFKKRLRQQIENEIESFKSTNLNLWQKKIWWNLFWVVPLTIFCLSIILFPSIIPTLNIDTTSIRIILGIMLLLVDGIFLLLIRMRYWDEGNIQNRIKNTKIPKDLQAKINELDDA